MPKGPEATLENELRKYMLSLGGFFPKSVSPGNKGWPDRNPSHWACGPFYMEIKRTGEESTDLQMEVAEEMASHGYRVYASVNSLRMGKAILEDEVNCVHPSKRRYHPVKPPHG